MLINTGRIKVFLQKEEIYQTRLVDKHIFTKMFSAFPYFKQNMVFHVKYFANIKIKNIHSYTFLHPVILYLNY